MSWDNLHHHYRQQDWSKIPSLFAKEVVGFFPKSGKILELWAWVWQDSRYFHSLWYIVDSTDFSHTAVEMNRAERSREIWDDRYRIFHLDIISDLENMSDECYDVVYAHLSLHYFPLEMTRQILSNISRILRPEGIIGVLLNTTKDLEYGLWIAIEDDFFEIPWQTQKRYFSIESADKLFNRYFHTVVCDDMGETYKDSAKWIHNLIRYIWKK